MSKQITRHGFLKLSVGMAAAGLVAACGDDETNDDTTAGSSGGSSTTSPTTSTSSTTTTGGSSTSTTGTGSSSGTTGMGSSGDSGSTGMAACEMGAAGTISMNHMHNADIPAAMLQPGTPIMDFDIMAGAGHGHTISLRGEEVDMLLAGNSVMVMSSPGGQTMHMHMVTLMCS